MSQDRLARARDFVLRNGRVLERHLFAFHFDGGAADSVIAALAAYQNADGGFGHGLEPDKRTPFSQPQDAEIALHVLDEINARGAAVDAMIARLCDWLVTVTMKEGGVPFTLPSANDFPHAPWWGVDDPNPPADVNPTAAIVGLLDKRGFKHAWIEPAAEFCWGVAETTETAQFHHLTPLIHFLEHAFDRPRAERTLKRLGDLVLSETERAPDAIGYVKKPLDWAPMPDAFCRRLFDDALIAAHLKALAARQRDDGGWPISWDPISPGVELEWRGRVTIDALKTLRAYGV